MLALLRTTAKTWYSWNVAVWNVFRDVAQFPLFWLAVGVLIVGALL